MHLALNKCMTFFLMFVIPMCLSNRYKYKISVKTQQFYFITTTPGLHISTPSSHHQALQGTDPILSKSSCTLRSQALTTGGIIIVKVHINSYNIYTMNYD
jgi:hypothetical protein